MSSFLFLSFYGNQKRPCFEMLTIPSRGGKLRFFKVPSRGGKWPPNFKKSFPAAGNGFRISKSRFPRREMASRFQKVVSRGGKWLPDFKKSFPATGNGFRISKDRFPRREGVRNAFQTSAPAKVSTSGEGEKGGALTTLHLPLPTRCYHPIRPRIQFMSMAPSTKSR